MSKNYDKHPTVEVGDTVLCKQFISFADGERHNKGDIFLVEEKTLAYFQLHLGKEYELVN